MPSYYREQTTAKDYALLVLRLAGLYLALGHGWGKIYALATGNGDWVVNMVSGLGFPLPSLFAWALAVAEFVGGLAVALGFATQVFAFLAGFAMFVATFLRHRALMQFLAWVGLTNLSDAERQAAGDPERAVQFLLIMVALLIMGGGRISLDRLLAERRR